MRFPADYHMHTPLCRHATGEPVEYARAALKAGLTQIGFSDHSPMEKDGFDDWRMNLDQLQDYIAKVEVARRECPGLTIRIGLEVDYLPGHEPWIERLASMHPWDYFIGSVHYIDDWALDNPHTMDLWRSRNTYEVWSAYFDRLTRAAASGLFNIIGHADLCKKFGFYPREDCSPMFEKFLRAALQTGTAIELNTAGLRKDCREIYPGIKLLKMANEMGVAITFGSDAHAPGEVGMQFGEAIALAKAAGYRYWHSFAGRKHERAGI